MLDIGDQEGALIGGRAGQDLLGQTDQLLGGRTEVAGAAGVDQTEGLAGLNIQQEEGLGLLGGRLRCAGTALEHVAAGVTDQAMRIQGQYRAGEVAAGAAQLAQADLQLLGFFDAVGFQ